MPHLDLTYFCNQSFWCFFIILSMYIGISEKFITNHEKSLNVRNKVKNFYDLKFKKFKKELEAERNIMKMSKKDINDKQEKRKKREKKYNLEKIKNTNKIIYKKREIIINTKKHNKKIFKFRMQENTKKYNIKLQAILKNKKI